MKPTKLCSESNSAYLRNTIAMTKFPRAPFIARISCLLIFAGLLLTAVYSASSASSAKVASLTDSRSKINVGTTAKTPVSVSSLKSAFNPAPLPVPPTSEGVDTFASDCSTPKSTFEVGDTVCVKVSGVPISFFSRRVIMGNANSTIIQSFNVTSDPQTFSFVVDPTTVIGGVPVDNRGTWHVIVLNPFFFYPEASTTFTVVDAAHPTADTTASTLVGPGTAQGGDPITFQILVKNYGPDTASTVELTDAVPANTTFVDFQQVSGPTFTCTNPAAGSTGTTSCTISSLVWPGTDAVFLATYQVNSGTATNTLIVNTASLTSTTNDQNTFNNTTSEVATVVGATGTSCTFDCPANIVATATSSSGAVVSFASAINLNGDCGAISASPASGSLFPVGTTTVNVSSGAGASCSFTVTVVNTPAPTISCPADKFATADSSGTATVAVGTPSTTPSTDVTVVGRRSDDTPAVYDQDGNLVTPEVIVPLTDPYPIGTTGITWTVTDQYGRTATCTQRILVHATCASDTSPPTITAPADITVGTGPNSTTCGVVLDDELGQASATDDCSATISTSGIPAGNLFPVGTTTVTYTATDGAGHTASAVQHVTVFDNTPPVIAAPADASYTCLEQVPAADASQATRGVVLDENGNPLPPGPPFDNCGTPTVTVSESASGAGTSASPRVITRTFTATDSHSNSASSVQTITVIDATPPSITAPSDKSFNTGAGATSCGTTVSNADLGSPTASDNCAGVTVSRSPSGNTFPVGTTTITWTATDAVGNTSTAQQTVTVVDNTPPVLSCPSNITAYLPLNSTATSMAVSYPAATATDNCGDPITYNYSIASGSVFPVGTTPVTVTATDTHSNVSSCTFTITVLYDFTGFFNPVINPPTLNIVNAGRAIPVKFSLSGNKGLNIFAANSPQSGPITCDASAPATNLTDTVNAGSSSLSYDASSDQYNYVWKTDGSWAGTCRQLVVTLNDGSVHVAYFKFK